MVSSLALTFLCLRSARLIVLAHPLERFAAGCRFFKPRNRAVAAVLADQQRHGAREADHEALVEAATRVWSHRDWLAKPPPRSPATSPARYPRGGALTIENQRTPQTPSALTAKKGHRTGEKRKPAPTPAAPRFEGVGAWSGYSSIQVLGSLAS